MRRRTAPVDNDEDDNEMSPNRLDASPDTLSSTAAPSSPAASPAQVEPQAAGGRGAAAATAQNARPINALDPDEAAAAALLVARPQETDAPPERFGGSRYNQSCLARADHSHAAPPLLPLRVTRGALVSPSPGSAPRGRPVAAERGGCRTDSGSGGSSGSACGKLNADSAKTAEGAAGAVRRPGRPPHVNSSRTAAEDGLPDYNGWDQLAEGFF